MARIGKVSRAGVNQAIVRDGEKCPVPASMKSMIRTVTAIGLLGADLAWPGATDGRAQTRVTVAAQAIGLVHRVNPTAEARIGSAFQLVQPMIAATVRLGRGFGARATVNLEGLTIPNGELTPGAWGEGFVDRRHPHTYWHEIILEGASRLPCGRRLQCRVGGFAGKGFVPFGSADPMTRPFARYPTNHHLAQILERAVAGIQLGVGPALIEGSVFNGDEPERPGQWPRIRGRFGDSWSLRATIRHRDVAEVAASLAGVSSPEHRPGAGANQAKRHLGLTVRPAGPALAVFGEWARTSELDGFFVYDTWLTEVAWRTTGLQIQYRFETTDRPEEERISPFRSARPHLENSILGMSRWTSHTIGATVPVGRFLSKGCVVTFGEVTAGGVRSTAGTAFNVAATYGKTTFTSLSIGLKVSWADHRSMGRYGLSTPADHGHGCR